jgi:hypothetical protein
MSPTAVAAGAVFQGIAVPPEAVNPPAFFASTRRKRDVEVARTFAGLGATDSVEIRKSDILSAIRIRFVGTVTTTGTTVKPTMRWPYDLLRSVRFTANGQSNLINVSGLKLKVREFMRQSATDRGVARKASGADVTQGTLSKASESWGVNPDTLAPAASYDVDVDWLVPIAEDERDLAGAIFAQTSTQDLVLNLDWNDAATLFGGTDASNAVTVTGKLIVETEKFSIPSANNHLIVPDLSLFHSLIESRLSGALAIGQNEVRLSGQGAGRQLLRVFYQVWNGNAPQKPLAATDDNFGVQSWRYGSNETPETFNDGRSMRIENENTYGTDIGGVWGVLAHEFNVTAAFRDTVDMGKTAELRLLVSIASGASLTNAAIEYVQETMFIA